MSKDIDWQRRFDEIDAFWSHESNKQPHVKTSMSGKHVDAYFNSDLVVSSPVALAETVKTTLLPEIVKSPDWVVGYAPYGLFLCYEVAKQLESKCAYTLFLRLKIWGSK